MQQNLGIHKRKASRIYDHIPAYDEQVINSNFTLLLEIEARETSCIYHCVQRLEVTTYLLQFLFTIPSTTTLLQFLCCNYVTITSTTVMLQ